LLYIEALNFDSLVYVIVDNNHITAVTPIDHL